MYSPLLLCSSASYGFCHMLANMPQAIATCRHTTRYATCDGYLHVMVPRSQQCLEMRWQCSAPETWGYMLGTDNWLLLCNIERATATAVCDTYTGRTGTNIRHGHTLTRDMTLWMLSLMSVITANAVDRITTHMTRKLNTCVLTRERIEFRTCAHDTQQ